MEWCYEPAKILVNVVHRALRRSYVLCSGQFHGPLMQPALCSPSGEVSFNSSPSHFLVDQADLFDGTDGIVLVWVIRSVWGRKELSCYKCSKCCLSTRWAGTGQRLSLSGEDSRYREGPWCSSWLGKPGSTAPSVWHGALAQDPCDSEPFSDGVPRGGNPSVLCSSILPQCYSSAILIYGLEPGSIPDHNLLQDSLQAPFVF